MSEHAELEAALARAHAAEAKVEALEIRLGLRTPEPRPREVRRPQRFTLRRGADLSISWRWSPDWFFLLFALLWNGLLGTVVVAEGRALLASPMSLFMAPHVIVGLVVGVKALASVANRTTIQTRDGLLEVIHGPIKLQDKRYAVATNDVRQLHSVKETDESATYKLTAVLGDDRQRTLLAGLTDDECRFLEVAFEVHLRIENEVATPPAG